MIKVIIVSHNNQSTIEKCLQKLKDNFNFINKPFQTNFEAILIDNYSSDETVFLAERFSLKQIPFSFYFIENKQNFGFAKGVNQGINFFLNKNLSSSNYFLLLNPDAYLEKSCLYFLIKKAQLDPTLGLVSPLILNNDKKIWFEKGKINWFKQKAFHQNCQKENFFLNFGKGYLSGCVMLIKKEVFEKIGFFDEKFFLFYEDVDFSLRAQRAGFKIALEPRAICFHQESSSFGKNKQVLVKKNYYLVKSGLIFFYKNSSFFSFFWFWFLFYLRLIFHKIISQKKEVIKALEDFKKEKEKIF